MMGSISLEPRGWLESQGHSSWTQRIKTPLVLLHNRIRLGGLGLLLKTAGTLLVFITFYQLVPSYAPERMRQVDKYRHVESWSPPEKKKDGGLRLVAFGSQDLMGSATDASMERLTWLQQLCSELDCSFLLSFVPTSDYSPGLTSNGIYSRELQSLGRIAEETDVTENPASDYLFVSEQHPVPQTPDLEAQVAHFLSLPPPEEPPSDTLWIFSFGTWDIWKVAAMPLQSGETVVDAMANHIFDTIEMLYRQSLNPKSIAFSNFWTNSTEEEFKTLADFDAASVVDQRKLESFRILIPQLFDVSLTPGWHNRPPPSIPHTNAEQLRNSALLTERWNSKIREHMDDWKKKRQASPEGVEGESWVNDSAEAPKAGSWSEDRPSLLRLADPEGERSPNDNVVYAPYPQRLGVHSTPADVILDTMMEEDMQRDGASDTQGHGAMSSDDLLRFADVWTPCVPGDSPSPGGWRDQPSKECKTPDQHLFYNSFTVGQRAIDELAKHNADFVFEGLILRQGVSADS